MVKSFAIHGLLVHKPKACVKWSAFSFPINLSNILFAVSNTDFQTMFHQCRSNTTHNSSLVSLSLGMPGIRISSILQVIVGLFMSKSSFQLIISSTQTCLCLKLTLKTSPLTVDATMLQIQPLTMTQIFTITHCINGLSIAWMQTLQWAWLTFIRTDMLGKQPTCIHGSHMDTPNLIWTD